MSNDINVSEISQTHNYLYTRYVEHTGYSIWKISGFTTHCNKEIGESLRSPTFRIPGDVTDWNIKLYPKGHKDAEGFLSLFLQSNVKEDVLITVEFSLISASGVKMEIKKFDSELVKPRTGRGFTKFLPRSVLLANKSRFLPNDELTISCIVTRKFETTGRCPTSLRTDPSSNSRRGALNDDLSRFLEGKRSTDVVPKVQNDAISSHKTLHACRSQIFTTMFERDMLEKETNEVDITDVEFDVLNCLARFMYTEKIVLPLDVDLALKLLVVADKYDVTSLRSRCADYLGDKVSARHVFQVMKVANACNEDGLVRRCMSVIEQEMSCVTCLKDWITKFKDFPDVLSVIKKLLNGKQQSVEPLLPLNLF